MPPPARWLSSVPVLLLMAQLAWGQTSPLADGRSREEAARRAVSVAGNAVSQRGAILKRRLPVEIVEVEPSSATSGPRTPATVPGDEGADAQGAALQLDPPRQRPSRPADRPGRPSTAKAITTVISSLAIVVGLFLLLAWLTRRAMPKRAMVIPTEVIEVLGRTPLSGRHLLHLVRFGNRLVLLSVTPQGAESLAEISDPLEVDRLAGICRQHAPHSVSTTFRQVLAQFGDETASGGFVADPANADLDIANAGVPARPVRD